MRVKTLGLVPVRSPLLTESLLLSFPRATEMFQFTRFPLPLLCVQSGVPVHDDWWVSPFGYPRITGWSAPTRGLSQPPTSFIGSCCQGIHRWPLFRFHISHRIYIQRSCLYSIVKPLRLFPFSSFLHCISQSCQ